MIGGGYEKDKKFVGKIIELCKKKPEINVVNDKYGSPTFARDFLLGIRAVIKGGNFGLYHLVNKGGACSRFEIAKEIVKILNLKVKINPVKSDCFPLPAPRAESEAMRNYKLKLIDLNNMPEWQTSLRDYLEEWRKNS